MPDEKVKTGAAGEDSYSAKTHLHQPVVAPETATVAATALPANAPEGALPSEVRPEIVTYEKLVEAIKASGKAYNMEMIDKAYNMANDAHKGVCRRSGEPYICHPLAVARLVLDLGMDTESIAAALLHDVVEDTPTTIEQIKSSFGEEVALLVDGVTKLTKIQFSNIEELQAENLRKMLLAMSRDVRVMIIKLCDRLHNMRTGDAWPEQKRRDKARETMEVYAPIANRLGILQREGGAGRPQPPLPRPGGLRGDQQDAAASGLARNSWRACPASSRSGWKRAASRVPPSSAGSRAFTASTARPSCRTSLLTRSMISMRSASFWIPWPSATAPWASSTICTTRCPTASRIIFLPPSPTATRACTPRSSATRASPLRCRSAPARWTRWPSTALPPTGSTKRAWMATISWTSVWPGCSQLLENQRVSEDSGNLLHDLKSDLLPEEVFAFTPKGDVINLPTGATCIDFAYAIHSAVGNRMVGCKVNNRMVPIDHIVSTGEIIEVILGPADKGPSRDWLKIVRTSEAKSKIRNWFKKMRREENIQEGRDTLARELRREMIFIPDDELDEFIGSCCRRLRQNNAEELYAAVGYGGITIANCLPKLKEEWQKRKSEEDKNEQLAKVDPEQGP